MLAPSVQIAFEKTTSPAEREMLGQALSLAHRLDLIEASFEGKINASKAARGEAPTKLSRSERDELQQLYQDEKELELQQLAELQSLSSAAEVVVALHMGLESDLSFWKHTKGHVQGGDVAIIRELVDAKSSLLESLSQFLKAYPATDN